MFEYLTPFAMSNPRIDVITGLLLLFYFFRLQTLYPLRPLKVLIWSIVFGLYGSSFIYSAILREWTSIDAQSSFWIPHYWMQCGVATALVISVIYEWLGGRWVRRVIPALSFIGICIALFISFAPVSQELSGRVFVSFFICAVLFAIIVMVSIALTNLCLNAFLIACGIFIPSVIEFSRILPITDSVLPGGAKHDIVTVIVVLVCSWLVYTGVRRILEKK